MSEAEKKTTTTTTKNNNKHTMSWQPYSQWRKIKISSTEGMKAFLFV